MEEVKQHLQHEEYETKEELKQHLHNEIDKIDNIHMLNWIVDFIQEAKQRWNY